MNLAWVGTGSNTLLYVNGSLQDSNAASITMPMTSIGNAGVDFLNGTVDEVATFGSALLDGEIKTLYLTAVGDQNPPGFAQNVPLISPAGTIYATTPFSLSADAYGAGPLTYQWLKDGTVVGTNITYAKASASLADGGKYDVIVSNAHGSITSSVATLTITTPAAGSYEAVVLASGPMAYWRLNEKSGDIAYDYRGGYDGLYTNVTLGQTVYSALDTDTSAGLDATQPSRVIVTDSAPFDFVGLTTPFSFEVWANFTDLSTIERLFSNRQPGGNGIGFGVNTANGLRFTTFGVQDFDQALPPPLQTGTWYHLAGVSEGGNFNFYLNGQLVGTVAFSGAARTSPAAFQLGCNPDGSEAVAGDLAEATVYNVALTPAEILTHYSVGQSGPSAPGFVVAAPVVSPTGTIYASTPFTIDAEPYGAGPLSYQWFKDGTLVGTNITHARASAGPADNGNYDLIVTSPYGSATSAMVTVAVNPVGGPLINDGNWHHLAVVFDRSASNAVSYVDGQWIDTRSIAGLGSLEDGQSLTIGQDPTGLYAVNGSFALDDLGIWRRALSGYEVLSIYNAAQNSGESFDVYGPVRVSIAPDGAQVILAWQAGTLESADALQGAQTVWTPVAGAAPPTYTFKASAAHKFYRIKL